MKTKIQLIALTFVLFSCGGENQTESNQNNDTLTANTETNVHEHDEDHDEIQLDNGKKWSVEKKMLSFIRNMENEIVSFDASNNTTKLEDYHSLSNVISEQLDSLTSNCTMTGQAHDELHKWLLPFIDLSNEYANVETIDSAQILHTSLKNSMAEFNEYFE